MVNFFFYGIPWTFHWFKMYILKYKIRNIKNINTLKFYLFYQFIFFLKIKIFYKIIYFS
jgi:hypothetical protein